MIAAPVQCDVDGITKRPHHTRLQRALSARQSAIGAITSVPRSSTKRVFDPDYASIDISREIVLPYPDHTPAKFAEPSEIPTVARPIRSQFVAPKWGELVLLGR